MSDWDLLSTNGFSAAWRCQGCGRIAFGATKPSACQHSERDEDTERWLEEGFDRDLEHND